MINDLKQILLDLSVLDIKRYLLAQGWSLIDQIQDKALMLQHKQYSEELILPMRKELGDFSIRMAELFKTLSLIKNRQVLSLINDINMSGTDIIRIRITKEATDGTLPFNTTSELFNNSKEMLLSAASAVNNPQKIYSSRRTDEVQNFINKLRVGQTEFGSYILTFLSPVSPKLSEQLSLFPDMEVDDDPFSRQTTKMLLKALIAAKKAAAESITSNSIEPFEKAISQGVSANLCDSIANIVNKAGSTEISLTWASNRPISNFKNIEKVFFDNETAEILGEVARTFKKNEPIQNHSITGWIYKLRHDQNDPEGTIYIRTTIEEKNRTVKTQLSENDYQKASKAHSDRNLITITGELIIRDKNAELLYPRNLIIENYDD
ncbi:MAG: hypothetical protein WD595_02010 [Waddliaceae bacterium]